MPERSRAPLVRCAHGHHGPCPSSSLLGFTLQFVARAGEDRLVGLDEHAREGELVEPWRSSRR